MSLQNLFFLFQLHFNRQEFVSITLDVLFYILKFKILYQQQQFKFFQVDYLFYFHKVPEINA